MGFRLLTVALLLALLSACSATIDEQTGRPVSNRVWFDRTGVAHCPICAPEVKRAPTKDETEASLVRPYRAVCEKGHAVVWAPEEIPCWRCDGAGRCPTCRGSGFDPRTGRVCPTCLSFSSEEQGRAEGTGRCSECDGTGTVIYGGLRRL